MNPQKRLNAQQQAEQQQQAAQQQEAQAREFGSVEEMLRHDALHTPVPPTIAYRLEQSIAREGPPPRPAWWRRLFGGGQ